MAQLTQDYGPVKVRKMFQQKISILTPGRGFTEINAQLNEQIEQSGVQTGLCNVFILHTSASLLVMENADPTVREDLERFMQSITPDGHAIYQHTDEGPDDMSAHVRLMLTQTSLTVPITNGRLHLGTWQSVYLWEHRLAGNQRKIIVTINS